MAHALIFDSGVGGLSVVTEIRKLMPTLQLTYVADDDFRPYGNKSEQALKARLPELLWTLEKMVAPDVIVLACNTASTTALEEIRSTVKAPVVGVVPAVKPAATSSRTKVIGLLGTPGTVQRDYVSQLISEFAGDCHVIAQGSAGLVDLAEKKLSGDIIPLEDVRWEIEDIFAHTLGKRMDTVVLACTHFPLLKDELRAAAPHPVMWVDSGTAIAKRVKYVLDTQPLSPFKTPERDIALLIGPDPSPGRRAAFDKFGFPRVVGLMG